MLLDNLVMGDVLICTGTQEESLERLIFPMHTYTRIGRQATSSSDTSALSRCQDCSLTARRVHARKKNEQPTPLLTRKRLHLIPGAFTNVRLYEVRTT